MDKAKKENPLILDDLKKGGGSWARFFKMLWKAKLPYLWIAIYIAMSFLNTEIGVNMTEITGEMFAGNVDFVTVILPFIYLSVLALLLLFVISSLSDLLTSRIDRGLRRMVWGKIVRLPLTYHLKNNPKELLSRITSDLTGVTLGDASGVSYLIKGVFIAEITAVYSLVRMLIQIGSYSGDLMWSLFAVIPLILIIAIVAGRISFSLSNRVKSKTASLTKEISEKASNMMLIKSFANESKELESGIKNMEELYKVNRRNALISSFISPLVVVASLIQVVIIILVGRQYYSNGTISLAQWIAYFGFAMQISAILTVQNSYWVTFKGIMGGANRVANLMAEKEEVRTLGLSADSMQGGFEFNNVTFGYNENNLFENFSLQIPEGKTTAFIGESGGGKTTLLNLLERFFELKDGTVTVGGTNINDFSLKEYRDNIGYVTQEIVVFSGTVKENIRYGLKKPVTDEEIVEACRQANALEFIEKLENGFDTDVGEAGSRLSGGQKQRIAIARTILQQPKYLFLDEATASLDVQAKSDVWKGLKNLMTGRTTVMVAHDFQTVQNADYVVVISNGKIADQGTKDELSKRNGFYKGLEEKTEDNG